MHPVFPSSAAGSVAPTEAYAKRVVHAARQFEAVLLNQLLGSLEHSFSALPGKKPDSIGDNYHAMGMQALASTLAASGGVVVASMIVRNLLHAKGQGPSGQTQPTKVSWPPADEPGRAQTGLGIPGERRS
jgi:Rod binding domain-containing protein